MKRYDKLLDCDTDKLLESSEKIINLSSEMEKEFGEFFKALDFESKGSDAAWFGNNANSYSRLTNVQKKDYIDFSQDIKALGKEIEKYANELDDKIKENEQELETAQDDYFSFYW